MQHAQQRHLLSSFHLDTLLQAIHVTTRAAAMPRTYPTCNAVIQPEERLRDVVTQLDLPAFALATPYAAGSRSEVARAAANVEAWMTYLPRDCVRTMVLEGWQWTT